MEVELKSLIDKIKKDGVEEAEKEANEIKKNADKSAKDIIQAAEKKAQTIVDKANQKANAFKESSEKALQQAARDVLLMLRERATYFFDRVVKEKVGEDLSPDVLKKIIISAIENLKKDGALDIEVMVNESDRSKLEKVLFDYFRKEAQKHIKLKGTKAIAKGFRIGEASKESYFDFSDEAIAGAFKKYLNPRIIEMLDIDLGLEK